MTKTRQFSELPGLFAQLWELFVCRIRQGMVQ